MRGFILGVLTGMSVVLFADLLYRAGQEHYKCRMLNFIRIHEEKEEQK
jgi:hypothetical protein